MLTPPPCFLWVSGVILARDLPFYPNFKTHPLSVLLDPFPLPVCLQNTYLKPTDSQPAGSLFGLLHLPRESRIKFSFTNDSPPKSTKVSVSSRLCPLARLPTITIRTSAWVIFLKPQHCGTTLLFDEPFNSFLLTLEKYTTSLM